MGTYTEKVFYIWNTLDFHIQSVTSKRTTSYYISFPGSVSEASVGSLS